MMLTAVKEFSFEAAHYLPEHPGACASVHGHHYVLQIGVKGFLQDNGMVIDFGEIKQKVESLVDSLDHSNLNEIRILGFPAEQPTAERMVLWFRKVLQEWSLPVSLIRLYETPTSWIEMDV